MLYFEQVNTEGGLSEKEIKRGLFFALDKLGKRKKVLAVPPDFTRIHSFAGLITRFVQDYYGNALTDILPAIGTHVPMTRDQIAEMFPEVPQNKFRVHNWRRDVVTLGTVPREFIKAASENKIDFTWPAQVNSLLVKGKFDLILSIGQVVPHEVIGMANYNKNIFVGTGGAEGINKSHFLGAVYGMERIMGRAENPVRAVLNYAADHFASDLPIVYVHTVVAKDSDGKQVVKGLFIGDDKRCFTKAANLSLQVNIQLLDEPLKKVIVYLHPHEFKSTWLGNKSIYRTRMAIADGGELIVLAPGVKTFGEDETIDRLIRKYGYRTTSEILSLTKKNTDLQSNLAAAAHLIHGSSENRFKIVYCPGLLGRKEIEQVGFYYADLTSMLRRYNPEMLKDGFNVLADGEKVFFISNPALGLWAYKKRFEQF